MDSASILKKIERLEAGGSEGPEAASRRQQTLAMYAVAYQLALLVEQRKDNIILTGGTCIMPDIH